MRAREVKTKDKDKAKTIKDTFVATFNLQAVLQIASCLSLTANIKHFKVFNLYFILISVLVRTEISLLPLD